MTRLARLLLPFLIFALATPAPAQVTSAAARRAWRFDRSDLAPHPGVRFGVLPNGMRYAIMRNAVPANGLAVRLHIDAGAAVEGERERGFMHLIEHMIFHGSENIPEGALPMLLAHRGLRNWSDVNAFTSYDETVYRIDMPRADKGARDAVLMVMRDVAGGLVFTRKNVAGAKKKVIEEIEARDAAVDRAAAAQNQFLLPGTPLARGPVAGSPASVRRADAEKLRRLYHLYYVPRRATLVVVGDVDLAVTEAEITARFSDWQALGDTAPNLPQTPVGAGRAAEARLFVDSQSSTSVTIASVEPVGGAADAGRARDAHFLERLGNGMLNRRLARAGGGNASSYVHFSTAWVRSLDVAAPDGNWRAALYRAATELRLATESGFSQAELDEQLAAMGAALMRDAAPRTSAAFADAIVDAVGRELVFSAPGNSAATSAYLARIQLADVNRAFRSAWSGKDKLIFVTTDRPFRGAEAAILSLWNDAMTPAP